MSFNIVSIELKQQIVKQDNKIAKGKKKNREQTKTDFFLQAKW